MPDRPEEKPNTVIWTYPSPRGRSALSAFVFVLAVTIRNQNNNASGVAEPVVQ